MDWVFDNISKTVKDVSDDIKDVSLRSTSPNQEPEPEVFNISNNLYTYDDAKSICSAYDASLATYDQIEKSYNGGGEWCSRGGRRISRRCTQRRKAPGENYKR
jgi:hypothetical protein